jgi:protein involved in polysaccharide export with SLBB domain
MKKRQSVTELLIAPLTIGSTPFFGLVLLLLALLSTSCKHVNGHYPTINAPRVEKAAPANTITVSRKLEPEWLKPSPDLFTLGPGDRLEIEVLGDPMSRAITVVAPDGKLYFNFLEGIDVWGATMAQAKALLENQLANYVREKPQVSIILRGVESKRIWVLGRVQAPGVYAMAAPMTLLEAVSMAGGTLSLVNYRDQEAAGINQELADLRHSFVIRQGKALPIDFERLLNHGDLSQNIYLQPDDFVYIPAARAKVVYVLGAVTQPRSIAYSEGMTVAGAVASAYGTLKGAYMHHVTVIRGSLTEPQVTIVDYKNVIRGEAPDMALLPHDIVYVPFSPYRYIQHYIEIAINTFASAAAINAGEAAVTKTPTAGAGVFIPVGSGISIIPPINPPPIH